MSELVEFLRARMDEDEAAARAAASAERADAWTTFPGSYGGVLDGTGSRSLAVGYGDVMAPETADHIARHDPARVLAEIEAKRRILARHCAAPVPPGSEWAKAYPYCVAHSYKGPDGTVTYPVELKNCPELRDLAAAYADHPDYREEWKP